MRVTSCCCCWSLKTGCIIISMYNVILSLLLLVSCSMDLYDILIADEMDTTSDYDGQWKNPIIRGMLWTFLAIISLHTLFSLLLLLGVMKEIRAILLIWIVIDIVFLVAVVSGMSVRLFLDPRKFMASIGKRIFSIIVGFYFLIVVKSFYSELTERQNNNADSV